MIMMIITMIIIMMIYLVFKDSRDQTAHTSSTLGDKGLFINDVITQGIGRFSSSLLSTWKNFDLCQMVPRRTLVCRSWSSSPINEIIFSSHFQACHKGYGLVIEKGSRTNWFRYQELIVFHRIFSLSLPVLCTIFFADIWPHLQRKTCGLIPVQGGWSCVVGASQLLQPKHGNKLLISQKADKPYCPI